MERSDKATDAVCPIWGTPAKVQYTDNKMILVNSPRSGGKYRISKTGSMAVSGLSEKQKVSLTSGLVRQRELGQSIPEVPDQPDRLFLNTLSAHQRAANLLLYISSEISMISQEIFIKKWDNHTSENQAAWRVWEEQLLACSESVKREELLYLLDFLQDKGWLERMSDSYDPCRRYRLTVAGHVQAGDLVGVRQDTVQVFVAMWFEDEVSEVYHSGIKPAVLNTGYKPVRVDQEHHLGKIDDKIVAGIRGSKFMVADLTHGADGVRGSVYFEVGYAMGLGVPVIFTCREDMINEIHFDIRQYPAIAWKSPSDIKEQLRDRILALIGTGK